MCGGSFSPHIITGSAVKEPATCDAQLTNLKTRGIRGNEGPELEKTVINAINNIFDIATL
jgi:hypothetical protein